MIFFLLGGLFFKSKFCSFQESILGLIKASTRYMASQKEVSFVFQASIFKGYNICHVSFRDSGGNEETLMTKKTLIQLIP